MHAAELLLFEALVKEPLPSLLLFFYFLSWSLFSLCGVKLHNHDFFFSVSKISAMQQQ